MKKAIKIVLIALLIVVFAIGAFSCNDADKYISYTMKVKEDGTFKILQLTDIHLIDSNETSDSVALDLTLRDEWALETVRDLIESTQPDMIMVTGDVTYNLYKVPRKISHDNYTTFTKVAKFIDGFGIPWAFCFGNHDEEGSLKEALHGDKDAAKTVLGEYLNSDEIEHCMFSAGPKDINGVGNYIINVLNADGSVNNALVVFDSGSFFGTNDWAYEYVHKDQLEWYEDAIKHIAKKYKKDNISSIVFQHIPFITYKTVLRDFIGALEADGKDWMTVIKPDGTGEEYSLQVENETITYHGGVYNEGTVCHSYLGWWPDKNTGTYYDGGQAEFDKIVELGSTKAVFCGHDHRNTYSFTYKGVRLTYGMSIDYSANGLTPLGESADKQNIYDDCVQRGGTLITLNADSSIDVTQVPFINHEDGTLRNLYREEVARRSAAQ